MERDQWLPRVYLGTTNWLQTTPAFIITTDAPLIAALSPVPSSSRLKILPLLNLDKLLRFGTDSQVYAQTAPGDREETEGYVGQDGGEGTILVVKATVNALVQFPANHNAPLEKGHHLNLYLPRQTCCFMFFRRKSLNCRNILQDNLYLETPSAVVSYTLR